MLPDLDDGDRTTPVASERFLSIGGNKKVWGTLRNISRHGVLIASRCGVPVRSRVRVVFEPESSETVAATGLVMWTRNAHEAKGGLAAHEIGKDDHPHDFAVLFEQVDEEALRFVETAVRASQR